MIDRLQTKKEFIILIIFTFITWFFLSEHDLFEELIEFLEEHEEYELDELFLLFIIMGISTSIFSIRRVFESTKINRQLSDLNKNLENKIKLEMNKRIKQEQLLIQQSKLASMGEMLGNIAHQWRQPLNALGLVMQNIHLSYEMGELDDEFMNRSVKKVNVISSNMSKTIDDFKNFFKPNKEKELFDIGDLVQDTVELIDATFEYYNIKIEIIKSKEIFIFSYKNELSQALINLLNNAKDALIENEIKSPMVVIKISKDEDRIYIKVKDNAGGIPVDILDKIFEPYFTTKEEGKGTGIGLYMSKTIIEQNMNGKLDGHNLKSGAEFIIQLPLSKDKS